MGAAVDAIEEEEAAEGAKEKPPPIFFSCIIKDKWINIEISNYRRYQNSNGIF